MRAEQSIVTLQTGAELLAQVARLKGERFRLVQVCSTTLADGYELTYSFADATRFSHLRILLPATAPEMPSITSIYPAAFAYENEMHDLFGIRFPGLALDFQGHFFRTSVATPFARPACGAPAVR